MQVAVASERLSTDPIELARSQVELACDQDAPVDERETALKALRSCRLAEVCVGPSLLLSECSVLPIVRAATSF